MEEYIIYVIMAIVFIVTTIRNYNKEKAKNAKRVVAKPTPPARPAPVAKPYVPTSSVPPVINTRKSQTVSQSLQSQRTLDEFEHDYSSQDAEEANAFSQMTDKSAFMLDADKEKEPAFDLHLNSHDDFKRAIIYSTILDRKS